MIEQTPEEIACELDTIEQEIKSQIDLENEKTLRPELLRRLKDLNMELEGATA